MIPAYWQRYFPMVLVLLTVLAADATAAGNGSSPGAAPQSFIHPKKKYFLAVPPGAMLLDKGGRIDVFIQSPKGYEISLQTGEANPGISLDQMAGKLEAIYLGQGKAWSDKLGQRSTTVAGMSAYDALYEGGNMRSRVVIIRGRRTDFVFMFFANTSSFETQERDFEWVLSNFRPSPAELSARPPVTTPGGAQARAPGDVGAVSMRRFAEPGFGFSIDFPDDWVFTKTATHSVAFSGRKGTVAYYAVVSIRNVSQTGASTPSQAAAQALAGLKTQIKANATDVDYIGEGAFTIDYNNAPIEGREFLASYNLNGQRFRKWTLVAPRPSGGDVHIWSYTSPEADFNMFRPLAEAMRDSWKLNER